MSKSKHRPKLIDLMERCHINEDGMWIWKAATSKGKPVVWDGGRIAYARRLAYQLRFKLTDEQMKGMDVWASTGNRLDINPDTAMFGTRGEHRKWLCANSPTATFKALAALKKSWDVRGRLFTQEQIEEIRSSQLSEKAEGALRGCSAGLIGAIRRGEIYRGRTLPIASVFTLGAMQ